jgi:hypothetical protein
MVWWPDNFSDWVVIASGIATTILVIIVGIQLKITRKEMDSRLHAYIFRRK